MRPALLFFATAVYFCPAAARCGVESFAAPTREAWAQTLFACRPNAIPGCHVDTDRGVVAGANLRPYRYLPVYTKHEADEWRAMYGAYEAWLRHGGAVDSAVRTNILFAQGATVGKSMLWMSHFVSAWAIDRGEVLNERWSRPQFGEWEWGQNWRLPCPEYGGSKDKPRAGLLCVFNLAALMSQRSVRSERLRECAKQKHSFETEALSAFRAGPNASSGIVGGVARSFDPYQPPPASPAALFTTSSFLGQLWSRGGLAFAVKAAVQASSLAAMQECGATRLRSAWPRAVSVHVRRGDACMRWADPGDRDLTWGRPCYHTEHYVQAAQELAVRYRATIALLATDDPDVLREARELSDQRYDGRNGSVRLRWCMVPDAARAAVGGRQWVHKHTGDQPVDWNTYPDSPEASMIERRVARGELDGSATTLSLLKDIDLLRRGVAFIGTFTSVTGRLMYLSMQGSMKRPPPYMVLDAPSVEFIV